MSNHGVIVDVSSLGHLGIVLGKENGSLRAGTTLLVDQTAAGIGDRCKPRVQIPV